MKKLKCNYKLKKNRGMSTNMFCKACAIKVIKGKYKNDMKEIRGNAFEVG